MPTEARQDHLVRETVAVTVVEVPVTMVDRSGNPVPNLTIDNFQLYDDGRRVRIAFFETVAPA